MWQERCLLGPLYPSIGALLAWASVSKQCDTPAACNGLVGEEASLYTMDDNGSDAGLNGSVRW